ncbi:RhoGAP domain containing protein [Histomonas meleagridis]|uniref:RhoGAP domain containing protein n=1 Tax=Histomonas meleagridis TaxID=135588 RepID=UPI00355A6490|nr:RhoGAP domain containing protein [Histomonas meleagridis]
MRVHVTSNTLVSDVIQASINFLGESFTSDPTLYGLFLKPHNKWLFPSIRFSEYRDSFKPDHSSIIEFRYRNPRKVIITFITYRVSLLCDPDMKIENLVYRCLHILRKKHPAASNCLSNSLFKGRNKIDQSQKAHTLFSNDTEEPNLLLKREIIPTESGAQNTIFEGNISTALEIDNNQYEVPFFFTKLLELINEKRDQVGIYRRSSTGEVVSSIVSKIESIRDHDELTEFLKTQQAHDLASIVKYYLRHITEPLFPSYLSSAFKTALRQNKVETLMILKVLIHSLPTAHYNLLKALSEHLNYVSMSPLNQMPLKNLAICIGPTFIRTKVHGAVILAETTAIQTIAQLIFENWRHIFFNEPCFLDTHRGTLTTNYEASDGNIIEKGKEVNLIKTEAEMWSIEYEGRNYLIPQKIVKVTPKVLVGPFRNWTNIGSMKMHSFKYLEPDQNQLFNEKANEKTLDLLKNKMNELDDIEKRLMEMLEVIDEDPGNEEKRKEIAQIIEHLCKI